MQSYSTYLRETTSTIQIRNLSVEINHQNLDQMKFDYNFYEKLTYNLIIMISYFKHAHT